MKNNTTVDPIEVAKFAQHATAWWDKNGPLKTLHDINPVRLAFIQQHINLKHARVLDVGCGGGLLSESMAHAGAVVTGLDLVPEALEAARLHAEASNVALDYECLPLEDFNAAPFDCITCMELLEHVADPDLIIEHASRLLKPGGLLFLSTISRTLKAYATAIVAAEYLLSLLPRQTHDFDKFIRPNELARALRAHDFEVTGLSGLAYNPITRRASLCDAVDVNYLLVARRR